MVEVGPGVMEDFRTGAKLFSIVCWSDERENNRRQTLERALAAHVVHLTLAESPDRRDELEAAYPDLCAVTTSEYRKAVRTLPTRLEYMRHAALISLPFFEEALTGVTPRLPTSIKRLSLNELAEMVAPNCPIKDPEDVEKKIWKPFKPIIHLAAALHVETRRRHPNGRGGGVDIQDIDFFRSAVKLAAEHENVARTSPRFTRSRDKLVSVIWRE